MSLNRFSALRTKTTDLPFRFRTPQPMMYLLNSCLVKESALPVYDIPCFASGVSSGNSASGSISSAALSYESACLSNAALLILILVARLRRMSATLAIAAPAIVPPVLLAALPVETSNSSLVQNLPLGVVIRVEMM